MKRFLVLLIILSIMLMMLTYQITLADGINATEGDTTAYLHHSADKLELNDTSLWERGGINANGTNNKSNTVARTRGYISAEIALIYAEKDYAFRAALYDAEDSFVGFWDAKQITTAGKSLYYLNPKALDGYRIRLVCQRLGGNLLDISECINIHFLNAKNADTFSPQPTLTFIDDDGRLDALENWESICDETGINITSALVTNSMGDENDDQRTHVSWSDVERLQSKGFEFVSHTHNHIDITKKSEAQCRAEFEASIAALREHGCEYRYLVYPYNAINTQRIELVKQYFSAGIGLGGSADSPGASNTLPLYTYWIRRYSINETTATKKVEYNGQTVDAHAFKDIDTLKGYIDEAIINGGWVIIMTHLRNDGTFYHDDESRQMIVELCEYAKEQGVAIQTFGEAFSRYENVEEMGNQSVFGNPHYIEDCNGVEHYRGADENGHIAKKLPAKLPTCTETGLTEGEACYICETVFLEQEVIPPTGEHIYDDDFDEICNSCGGIREITLERPPGITVFGNEITVNANGMAQVKVHTFCVQDWETIDVDNWSALKAADPNFKTYAKESFTLQKNGYYVLRVQYTNTKNVIQTFSYQVLVDCVPPDLSVTGNEVAVNANGATGIKVHAFHIEGKDITDINNWNALKAADPDFKTYTKQPFSLQKNGKYVLRVQYTAVTGAMKVVSYTASIDLATPEICVVGNSVTVNANGATGIKVHAFYVEGADVADINDWYALKTADPNFKSYAKVPFSLQKNGKYILRMQYLTAAGATKTISCEIEIACKLPDVHIAGNEVGVKANGATGIKVHAFYVEGSVVADINNWSALKAVDPNFKTYAKEQFSLTRKGSYVLRMEYVDESGNACKTSWQICIE